MKRNNERLPQKGKLFLVALLVTAMTIACGVLEVGIENPDQPIRHNEDLPPTLDPSSEQQENPQSDQKQQFLNPNGPWLVFITGTMEDPAQIWAANPDGSGMTVLADDSYFGGIRGNYFTPQISPNGQFIAYIDVREEPLRAYLHVIDLTSGENKLVVMLYDESFLGYSQEILDAILYQAPSLAWSPDGQELAFIGAMEGGSADLYLHNPTESSVTRLNESPDQAYMPVWSQNGETILHTATSEFHRGEGYSPYLFTPDGLWSVDVDSYTSSPISWPFGDEPAFIKYSPWHGSRFIFFGNGSPCEDANGCWLDVRSGESGSFPFPIVEFTISPDNGELLAASFNTTMPSDTAGAYLFTLENPIGTRLFENELDNIQWLDQARVFAAQDVTQPRLASFQIDPDGIVTSLEQWDGNSVYARMAVSPDGQIIAWHHHITQYETGLWTGNVQDETLTKVFSGPVHDAIWSPDGLGLFFIVDEFNPTPGENIQGLYLLGRDKSEPEYLFSIPAENYISILGFAGN